MCVSKNMPKMFEYQKKIVENDKAKVIVGNFSRCAGKSYTMACKILYDRPNLVLFVANSDSQFNSLQDKFKEIFTLNKEVNSDLQVISYSKERIIITFTSGEITNIYNYRQFKKDGHTIKQTPDLVLYSDYLPVDNISGKQIISIVSMPINNLKKFLGLTGVLVVNAGLKELYDNRLMNKECIDELKEGKDRFFIEDIDLFSEYESIFGEEIISKAEWIDNEIEKLMTEFSNVDADKNTTMTREKILGMIENLMKLKSNYNIKIN